MSGPEHEGEDEETLVVRLRHHPVLDGYLSDRGWVRVDTGQWRWLPSLADTPEDTWDVTTVMWDGSQVLVGMVGDWLTHMFVHGTLEQLAGQIEALEAMRYEP